MKSFKDYVNEKATKFYLVYPDQKEAGPFKTQYDATQYANKNGITWFESIDAIEKFIEDYDVEGSDLNKLALVVEK